MPVLFNCQQCHQPIRASRRKGGTLVACPQCGQGNLVPVVPLGDAEPAAAAKAEAAGIAGGFDDIPDLIAAPVPPPVSAPPATVPFAGLTQPHAPRPTAGTMAPVRVEDALLVISRRGVYALGGLLLLVALVFLGAGYLIGRGPAASNDAGHAKASDDSSGTGVVFEGNLAYAASSGQIKPDTDAVAIALPFEKRPGEKLAGRGLRPSDTGNMDDTPAAAALHALGGACVRAGADGEFQLVVPRPGKYFLLVISKHAKRAGGRTIEFDDLRAIDEYFERTADLVGPYRYDWSVHELAGAPPRFTHEF